MRNKFDMQLDAMNQQLIQMGELCVKAIANATSALAEGNPESAEIVIGEDQEIDQMEKNIEHACLKLLLEQQPVASDLRQISAALKMITDMERIGDQAADIAEIIISAKMTEAKDIKKIQEMASATSRMVRKSIEAFVNKDLEMARKVIEDDDVVDHLFDEVRDELITFIAKSANQGDVAIDLVMITKYLERIGDHAADIAELVIRCKECDLTIYSSNLKPMLFAAREMVEEAIDSLIQKDSEKARRVIDKDDIVDGLFNDVKGDVVAHLQTNPGDVDYCIDALMIAKYLERVGDHAVNISEWEMFQETGTIRDVRIL